VRNARPGQDEFRKWETNFTLSQDAGKRFARFTEANVGNRLAVILDNQIRSVATIQNRIEDSGRITGQASEQEASDLSLVLRAGALPAGIVFLQETSIGPSLGADSIHQGIMAGLAGLALVIGAMLVYYKGAGINAVVALVLGGSQALSRSLFSLMIPRRKEAEYFGLYEISDKGTSWLAPLLFGLALQLTHSYRLAILSLVVFFVAGFIVLLRVDVRRAAMDAGNQPV
jgi:hypothetical protein